MTLRDSLLTVILSAATTVATHHFLESHSPGISSAAAAGPVNHSQDLVVDRLVVRNELIVSDTERPWDDGFEDHQIPRGVVIRSLTTTGDGQWTLGTGGGVTVDSVADDELAESVWKAARQRLGQWNMNMS